MTRDGGVLVGAEVPAVDVVAVAETARAAGPAYVSNRRELGRLLAVLGTRVTLLETSRRERLGAELVADEGHRSLGRMLVVSGDEFGIPVLSDGSSFPLGAKSEWSFNDGLATQRTSLTEKVFRISAGDPVPNDGDEQHPELAGLQPQRGMTPSRLKVLAAVRNEYLAAVRESVAMAGQNPGAAIAGMDAAFDARRAASRLLDGTQSRLRDMADDEWLAVRDVVEPELLAAAVDENEAWSVLLTRAEAHVSQRAAVGKAGGHNVNEMVEHLSELRASLRGLRAEKRLLDERGARRDANGA